MSDKTEPDMVALDVLTSIVLEHYNSHPLDIARAVLASHWLAGHDAEVRRAAGEQIAQAIEDIPRVTEDGEHRAAYVVLDDAAWIAREVTA